MSKNLVIIFGGNSTEHDVSIVTALQIYKRYADENTNVSLVYITHENEWYIGEELSSFSFYRTKEIKKLKQVKLVVGNNALWQIKNNKLKKLFDVDFVLNCCHGGDGENGNLTSLLSMCNIPSSTGDSTSLNVAMDKYLTKIVSIALDIPTVDFFTIDKFEWNTIKDKIINQVEQFGYPLIVKPSRQGSSIGVCFVESFFEFEKAVSFALGFDERIIVERAIVNKREFNCSVIRKDLEPVASQIEEPVASGTIITFNDKYLGGKSSKAVKGGVKSFNFRGDGMAGAERKYPAEISTKLKNEIVKYSKYIYSELNMCGVVRIDYIYDVENKNIYLGEINSIPGSLGYYFWSNINFLDVIVDEGVKYWEGRHRNEKSMPIAKIFH